MKQQCGCASQHSHHSAGDGGVSGSPFRHESPGLSRQRQLSIKYMYLLTASTKDALESQSEQYSNNYDFLLKFAACLIHYKMRTWKYLSQESNTNALLKKVFLFPLIETTLIWYSGKALNRHIKFWWVWVQILRSGFSSLQEWPVCGHHPTTLPSMLRVGEMIAVHACCTVPTFCDRWIHLQIFTHSLQILRCLKLWLVVIPVLHSDD